MLAHTAMLIALFVPPQSCDVACEAWSAAADAPLGVAVRVIGGKTRRVNLVRNPSLQPGDIIDIKNIPVRKRLKLSDLFQDDPATGERPRIIILPPEPSDDSLPADLRSATRID
jgi:hypothetical protein